MRNTEGRFCRVHQGLPYAARVTVRVSEDPTGPAIVLQCSSQPPFPRSDQEDTPAAGYDDWKEGAVVGARYALEVAGRTGCRVLIARIMGMTTDTNPTVVGAAAMDAVWQAIGHTPSAAQVRQVEQVVFGSWQQPYNAIPDFGPAPT
jgi:hypothetical protein